LASRPRPPFGRCPGSGVCGFDSRPCYSSPFVPSFSGQDACLTHRLAQVRVLPGRLSAGQSAGVPAACLLGREGDRVRFSGRPSCELRATSSSFLYRAAGPTERHRLCTPEIGVRLPGGPLERKVVGYGLPSRSAKAVSSKGG